MPITLIPSKDILGALHKNWLFFFVWGIVLLILGGLAIYYSTVSTIITVVMIGIFLFVSGIIMILDTFQFWWRKGSGFYVHLLLGLLYIIGGALLFMGPVLGAISLTLFLGTLFIISGIFRMYYSLTHRYAKWDWSFFSGLITFILGLLVIGGWPASSLFILGLFVGIDLMLIGWTYIMIGLASRNQITV